MLSKVCPRCGAQYENLRSTTCPQCFAKLLVIDEATAEELAAARAQVEQSPEFQETKAADDERFREQSFGACAGVLGIIVLTAIVVISLLFHAFHKSTQTKPPERAARMETAAGGAQNGAPTTLPVGDASLSDVVPATLEAGPDGAEGYRRTGLDQTVVVPGTLVPIFHGSYAGAAKAGGTADVYAVSSGASTAAQNAFRLGVTLAASAGPGGSGRRSLAIWTTEHWLYASVGAGAADGPAGAVSVEGALLGHFRRLGG